MKSIPPYQEKSFSNKPLNKCNFGGYWREEKTELTMDMGRGSVNMDHVDISKSYFRKFIKAPLVNQRTKGISNV